MAIPPFHAAQVVHIVICGGCRCFLHLPRRITA
ncbi:MAG: hypothetical protein GX197_10135 [Firmicutes bacterium]|nr:hypothetical protein [Bacillota bacterium]